MVEGLMVSAARESITGDAQTLLLKLRTLIEEGNARRVLIKHEGRTVAAFPLTGGVIGDVVARTLSTIGLVAVLKDCSLEIEKTNNFVIAGAPNAKAS
jgi:uncharacterized protein DUF4342